MTTATLEPAAARRLSPRHWGVLIGVLLIALLPGFFTIPVMDRDEARYSQAASQMIETGDYIDIRFQEQPRHVKPAGIYWMQVLTATPFGGSDAPIWAFRLPSLFGILIAAGATAFLTARIGGARTGVLAGTLLGLTLAAAVEARTAKTDGMLLASAAIAQTALYFILVRGQGRDRFVGAPLVFWAATGAAIMIKGPIVTMVSATTIAGYALWVRDRAVFTRLRILPGALVAAAIALPWLIAITIRTDGAFLAESVGHALFGKVAESDDSHAGPFGYHTLLLPITFWPGTLLLGLGGVYAWVKRAEPTVRFLLAWLLPTWIIFEFVATKLPHYVLPTFPAIAILAALGFADAARLAGRKAGRVALWGMTGLFVLVCLVVAALAFIAASELGGARVTLPHVLAAIFGVLAAGLGIFTALRLTERNLALTFAAAIGAYWALFGGAIPQLSGLWPSNNAATLVTTLKGCETLDVVTAGYREPSNVFHFGTDTRLAETGDEAARWLAQRRECGVAIIDRAERESFEAEAEGLGLAVRSVGRATGTNTVKGRELALDIFITRDGALSAAGGGI